jgi:hypothetical protein
MVRQGAPGAPEGERELELLTVKPLAAALGLALGRVR